MSLKKLGLALVAVLVLGAVVANSAMAVTAIEKEGFWYRNGTKLATGVANALPITCSIGKHNGASEFILESTVGTNNVPLKLKATGVECPEGKIFNESNKAKATGKIKFTGVSVVAPTGCMTPATVTTQPLKGQIWMEGTGTGERTPKAVFFKFEPASGTTFAEVEIEGCSIANVYPARGTVFGEGVKLNETTSEVQPTGIEEVTQRLTFSKAINETAGGALTFGGKAAYLTGRGNFTLKEEEPKKWGVNET